MLDLARMISSLIAVGIFCAASTAADSLARLVPANAAVYVSIAEPVELERRWHQTQFGRLWRDPQLTAFRQAATRDLQPTRRQPPRPPLPWQDIVRLASGEVCWALVEVGDQQWARVELVDVRGNEPLVREYLASGGLPEDSGDGLNQAVTGHTLVRDGVLALADRAEPLQQVALLFERPADSLANRDPFQRTWERCLAAAGDHPIHARWFVASRWLDHLAARTAGDPAWAMLAKKNDLGLDILQAVGGVLTLREDDYDLIHHASILAPGERKKAAGALRLNKRLTWDIPSWLPVDVATIQAIGWQWHRALDGYAHWFDQQYADGVEDVFVSVLDDIRDEQDGPRVDVRRELIDQLTGPLWSLSHPVRIDGDWQRRDLYAVRIDDAAVVADALRRMLEGDPDVTQQRDHGVTWWAFKEGQEDELEWQQWGPDLRGSCYAVANGLLLAANNRDVLLEFLGKATKPQPTNAPLMRLRELAQNHRAGGMISWQLSPSGVRTWTIYDALRRDGERGQAEMLVSIIRLLATGTDGDGQGRQLFRLDFSRLPPLATNATYFGPSLSFASDTEDGWLLSDMVLAPRELTSKGK